MPRRKHDKHLPPCVYHRHGAYWLVKRGKWSRLGTHLPDALAEYARRTENPEGGMAALIADALPDILAGKAASTQRQYREAAARLQHMLAEFAPHQVLPRHVVDLQGKLPGEYAVANRTIGVLRQVFDWALRHQLVDANPCVGIKRLKQAARTRRLTITEFHAIREHAKPRHRIVMDLCYLTGQRIGDVLAIKRTDCGPAGIAFEQQKTGARLVVAWTPALKAAVEAAKAMHGPVPSLWLLKGREGRPMTYTVAWKDWCAARAAAGVEDANIHDLRAMAATDAEAQGRDPQKLLGHSSERTTRLYLRAREIPVVAGPALPKKSGRRGQK